jgi:hypothetical protein
MEDEPTLTDEDVAAINAAEAEIDRGEGTDFDDFAARMRAKYPLEPKPRTELDQD